MDPVQVAQALDRSVLGSLVDFAFHAGQASLEPRQPRSHPPRATHTGLSHPIANLDVSASRKQSGRHGWSNVGATGGHMSRFWMVRAGKTGRMAGRFERLGVIGIQGNAERRPDTPSVRPWGRAGERQPPEMRKFWLPPVELSARVFMHEMSVGDNVATFDPSRDEYILGTITGDPEPNRGRLPGFTLLRSVEWGGRISRNLLGAQARAALERAETMFEPGAEVVAELRRVRAGPHGQEPWVAAASALEQTREKLAELRKFTDNLVRTRVCMLDAARLRTLTLGLLGAMGFRVRAGDPLALGDAILASPDGFGLGGPRVLVEIRAGREPVDRRVAAALIERIPGETSGMIVCPGGFDDHARRVAGRAPSGVVLVDAEELTALLLEHYREMSPEARAALPLSTLYLPVF
jgi:restriction system protein